MHTESPPRSRERTHTEPKVALAYGAFLTVGAVVSFKQVLNVLGTGSDNLYYGGFVFTVLPVAFVLALVAAGVGIVLACVAWREWPLLVLAAGTALLPAVGRIGEQHGAVPSLGGVYIAVFTLGSLLVPAHWFLVRRHRTG